MILIALVAGLLIGFAETVPTGLTGKLCLGELFAIAYLPLGYYWLSTSLQLYRKNILFMCYCLTALAVWQVLIDQLHETPIERTLEILGTLGFTAVKILVYCAFFGKNIYLGPSILFGYSIGQYVFLKEITVRNATVDAEYWDLNVAPWSGPLLIAILLQFNRLSPIVTTSGLAAYGAVAGYFGARSHGMCIILGTFLPWLIVLLKRTTFFSNKRSLTKILVFSVVASFIVTVTYVEAAKLGLLTRKSQEQISALENPYNPIQLAMSARGGSILGLVGALEHPFIGFGSKQFYSDYYVAAGIYNHWSSVHSVVVESMAYGGMLTLVFWWFFFKSTFVLYPPTEKVYTLGIVASIAMLQFLWAGVFSPFVSMRTVFPFYIAVMVYCDRYLRTANSNTGLAKF